jgi:MoaA/NifB/PqqE/SkfB family radical SAM enzyme
MTSIRESMRRLFKANQPLPPGIYHYQAPQDDPNNYRLHLRLEQDGSGVLIVNASTVLHLNQTAAEFAYYLVQNLPEDQAVANLADRYRVKREQARQDFHDFVERIDTLIKVPDLDPVSFLDFERTEPFTDHISSPYRLDCALTYLVDDEPGQGPLHERVEQELTTEEWTAVLDKAWSVGIPHIVFTGGEPTLREDLISLIQHAEDNGQVTGLMTDGLRLADQEYLQTLLQTGLDHLTLIFLPDRQEAWQALESALAEDIFVAVHLTITEGNREEILPLIEKLAGMGVKAVSLSASSPDLQQDLEAARELETDLDIDLVWNLPVPYSELNPLNLETDMEEIQEGAGKAWMYVEPDGDVLPAQGVNKVLGNFIRDPWETIWK